MLFCAAMTMFQTGLQAQGISFEQDRDFRDMVGWPSHRGTPFVADFNNDGLMDVYLNGTSCVNGWQARGVLAKNLGERQFIGDSEPIMETYIELVQKTERVQDTNDDGTPKFDENGEPVMIDKPVVDENGEPVMEEVERQRFVGMKNGLPLTIRGFGSQPLDFNGDGLVDFIFLNQGGNDTGTKQSYVLVKNIDGTTFEVVDNEALASIGLDDGSGGARFNEATQYSSLVTGDYDKDGLTDVLVTGNGPKGRYVKLLRSTGTGFEEMAVFNPLSFEEEINRKGLYKETESGIDPDTGDPIPGDYTQEPTKLPKQLSHGSVVFIDLDGDSWLDIVMTGWADGTDDKMSVGPEPGGNEIRFYRNLQNGEFQDVTPELIPSAKAVLDKIGVEAEGTIMDVFQAWGCEEGLTMALDYDQNGRMDLMQIGTQGCNGNRPLKQANCLINMSDEEGFKLEEVETSIAPVAMSAFYRFLCADFNGDDYPDYWQMGWTSKADNDGNGYGWSAWVDLSQGAAEYENNWFADGTNEYFGAFLAKGEPGENAFGDMDGDGKIDLLTTGWTDKSDDHIISYNTADIEVIAPSEVDEVLAEAGDGRVTVKWQASSMNNGNQAMFNLYIKNNETGATRMVVPANIETGKQLCYSMFGCYVTSGNEDGEAVYVFDKLPVGQYTVGVQAVNYAYTASGWTTAPVEVTVSTGVQAQKADKTMKVSVDGDAITVASSEAAQVAVFNMSGAQVAAGMTNEAITVKGHGVFVVKAAGRVVKVVK